MAAYVLDASVLATLYVDDPATEQSEAALEQVERDDLHAPDFVMLEVANVLWKRVRREELHAEDAMAAIADLSAASISSTPWVAWSHSRSRSLSATDSPPTTRHASRWRPVSASEVV